MVDRHVSMSEIARLLGLTLPAVSNWRRRHPSFPVSVEDNGLELFPAQEIASWLDGRKISKKDLEPDELPGTTYGTRFRAAMKLGHAPANAIDDAVWRELIQFRGDEDVAVFADLVLGLLYLATVNDPPWNEIATTADPTRRVDIAKRAALSRGHELRHLQAALELEGPDTLVRVIELVERVRLSGRGIGVFTYLLDRFAAAEGRRGAAVHTPDAVVRLLVELAAPVPGNHVFDPCCGSGGFLVGAAEYLGVGGRRSATFTGRALSERSAWLARMNTRIHRVRAGVVGTDGLVFSRGGYAAPQERFDVVVSNPPFDMKAPKWLMSDLDERHGWLPKSRTSFAWLRYVMASLTELGRAAVVMPGGTLFREGAEKHVRAQMVTEGVVEAIIALPAQLFGSTAVPVTVWLLRRRTREQAGEMLFIDASALGNMISRTQRTLSDEDRSRIVGTVLGWRDGSGYTDVLGFSASVTVDRVRDQDYVLTPARYVGASFEPDTPATTVYELRAEIARLEYRAAEVNAVVERELDRISPWIR
jgi:type I restriction enzyme M protein